MIDRKALAEFVLEAVGGRAAAEVQIDGGTSSLTRFANSFIHQNVGEEGDAVSLRVTADGRTASGTTTNLDEGALRTFVDDALARAALQPVDDDWPGLAPPAETPPVDHYDEATAAASPAARAQRVADFVDAGPGMRAAGYCETSGSEVVFANSVGARHTGRYSRAIVDGVHQTGTSAGSGHACSVRLGDLDAASVGALAAQRANDGVNAHDTKPGEYEVVLAPECVATIGIFLASYGFNAKLHEEGQSFVALGTAQFDPRITLVDDVADPRAIGVGFDTEGTPRRRTELVKQGVSTSLAHNRRTARRAGTESTGHAVPGSDVWGPLASSIFLEAGSEPVGSLIASVDRGLYVATFNYCRVLDPKTMAVTGLTRNGTFLIENGRITGAASGLRFTQSFVEALSPGAVLGVGNDARFADSEFGPGMLHVPSLRLASWNFTGGTEG